MSEQKLEAYFFTTLFICALLLVGVLFFPFIGALALALVLAILFTPSYASLAARTGKPNLAASIIVFGVTIAIILPAIGIIALLVGEARNTVEYLSTLDKNTLDMYTTVIGEHIRGFIPTVELIDIPTIVQGFSHVLGSLATTIVTETLSVIFGFAIAIIALFFFLRDGARFVQSLISMSPLSDDEDVRIVHKLGQVTHSLIRGTLVVASLQGILTGLGFLIFGIPNPVLWGTIAAVSALVPNIGTGLIATPAIAYLFLLGATPNAIGLLAWSVCIVGLLDNIIGPRLIGGRAHIHSLFILISVLGGLSVFGLAGFLLGPLILGLLVALAEIYKVKIRQIHELSE